nr:HK97 gp10 family phage protein [Dehalococcoidales bacterium]
GLKECMDALEQLPTLSMKKTVVRNALKKCAAPIAEDAKNNAPWAPKPKEYAKSKHFRDTIKVSTSLKASQRGRFDKSRVTVYVGSTAPHAHLIEFGTTARFTKSGAYRGFTSPVPFMRNAWDNNKMKSLNMLKEELWKSLEKSAKLLAKKAAKGTLTKGQRAGLR